MLWIERNKREDLWHCHVEKILGCSNAVFTLPATMFRHKSHYIFFALVVYQMATNSTNRFCQGSCRYNYFLRSHSTSHYYILKSCKIKHTSLEISMTPERACLTSCFPTVLLKSWVISSIFAFAARFFALFVKFFSIICKKSKRMLIR